MTAQKHKKKRIRQRMAKTGESYQAALRRLNAAANLLDGGGPWTAGSSNDADEYRAAAAPSRDEISIQAISPSPAGFASMLRRLDATAYRGRRLRLGADLRTDAVTGQAVVWMRMEDLAGLLLGRADTEGTDGTQPFTRRSLVVDVPLAASRIVLGCRLHGSGAITARDFLLEVVSKRVARTPGWQGGWHATGSAPHEYQFTPLDPGGAGEIHARHDSSSGFATVMRIVSAEPYRGRRIRFMADVELVGVLGSAGLWMRIDAGGGKSIAFGSTQKASWDGVQQRHPQQIVLDVPPNAARIFTGYLLHGGGCIRARGVALEVVDGGVRPTVERDSGWQAAGTAPHAYVMKLLDVDGRGSISARSASPPGFATFTRRLEAEPYRGQRVRFRGRVRAESVTGYAALWLRADSAQGEVLAFDSLQRRAPIVGTRPFSDQHVTITVPPTAARIFLGYLLDGAGEIEATELALEVVRED